MKFAAASTPMLKSSKTRFTGESLKASTAPAMSPHSPAISKPGSIANRRAKLVRDKPCSSSNTNRTCFVTAELPIPRSDAVGELPHQAQFMLRRCEGNTKDSVQKMSG
jgi:hypothetical protein